MKAPSSRSAVITLKHRSSQPTIRILLYNAMWQNPLPHPLFRPAPLVTLVSISGNCARNCGMTSVTESSPWSNPKRRPPAQAHDAHSATM
jgi:hypothetical protein